MYANCNSIELELSRTHTFTSCTYIYVSNVTQQLQYILMTLAYIEPEHMSWLIFSCGRKMWLIENTIYNARCPYQTSRNRVAMRFSTWLWHLGNSCVDNNDNKRLNQLHYTLFQLVVIASLHSLLVLITSNLIMKVRNLAIHLRCLWCRGMSIYWLNE